MCSKKGIGSSQSTRWKDFDVLLPLQIQLLTDSECFNLFHQSVAWGHASAYRTLPCLASHLSLGPSLANSMMFFKTCGQNPTRFLLQNLQLEVSTGFFGVSSETGAKMPPVVTGQFAAFAASQSRPPPWPRSDTAAAGQDASRAAGRPRWPRPPRRLSECRRPTQRRPSEYLDFCKKKKSLSLYDGHINGIVDMFIVIIKFIIRIRIITFNVEEPINNLIKSWHWF